MQDQALRTLIALGNSVLEESELELVLQRVISAARELTGARYAALGVLDGRRERLERFLTTGIDGEARELIGDPPSGHGVLGELIRHPEPLRLHDVGAHARSYGFPVGHPPMRSFLGVPILVGGEAWGNLYLTEKDDDDFTDDDEQAVVMLARYAGIAIDNARRIGELSGRRDELERTLAAMRATTEISRALAGETDLDVVLELIAKRGRALVGASALLIELVTGDRIRVAAAAGAVDREIVGRDFEIAATVAGTVLETRRPQRLTDELNRSRFENAGIGRFGLTAGAGLFVPLVFRSETPGVLVALNAPDAGDFSAEDERLLTSFATSAASAVVTARSVGSDRLLAREAATEDERRRWARELHDETLQGLGALRLALSAARRAADPEVWRAALDDAVAELDTEIANVRGIISDVRPAALDELGLGAAIEALADRIRARGIDVELRVDLDWEAGRADTRHDDELETALYRIAQEAMTNGVKHAAADALVVEVSEADGRATVRVRDDGQGFDPSAAPAGFGLVGMRERVELLGGNLEIEAAPGAGTTVIARLPVRRRAAAAGADRSLAAMTARPMRS
ncbi:MAG TPA: GAF domain-containing protein, partial [Solirubrobacteraceae bacterium]|nr:GAF domain-containing protein [Solirubrobacteraceae bacterium]